MFKQLLVEGVIPIARRPIYEGIGIKTLIEEGLSTSTSVETVNSRRCKY
jgi:hypothetical protein